MVTFLRVARPMFLRLAGGNDTAPHPYRVRAGFDHKKKRTGANGVRARLAPSADGTPVAEKFPRAGRRHPVSMVDVRRAGRAARGH